MVVATTVRRRNSDLLSNEKLDFDNISTLEAHQPSPGPGKPLGPFGKSQFGALATGIVRLPWHAPPADRAACLHRCRSQNLPGPRVIEGRGG